MRLTENAKLLYETPLAKARRADVGDFRKADFAVLTPSKACQEISYYPSDMSDRPQPELREMEAISLVGTMTVYDSQSEASRGIPEQWRRFLGQHPGLGDFYGASPCTNDRKIHYLAGVGPESPQRVEGVSLRLEAGEYAVVQVDDPAQLRDTWVWLLTSWLAGSGRHERHAPEFERYTDISEGGTPVGLVEIWIPLEPNTV